jgi:hypothetical protein
LQKAARQIERDAFSAAKLKRRHENRDFSILGILTGIEHAVAVKSEKINILLNRGKNERIPLALPLLIEPVVGNQFRCTSRRKVRL